MYYLMLTEVSGILGPIAKVLGLIMAGIFWVLDKIGIPNLGLVIIIFTFVIYLLLLPLTYKQQKFSKFSAIMNPEIQAIQAKYKGRQDPDAMQAMNMETQAVYAKYGVNPMGSCVQLLIQMPILFSLYRVIYAIPAYVPKIKEAFFPFVTMLSEQAGSSEFIQTLSSAAMFKKNFKNELFTSGDPTYVQNTFIDVLNRASKADWDLITDKFPALSTTIESTLENLEVYNNFLSLNIAYSPWDIIRMEWVSDERSILIIVLALMIPLLAGLTQWIGFKLSPATATNNDKGQEENYMMASMKTMNNVMPIISIVFCFTFPVGMGLYWIAGAVIRAIQQIVINKYIDHMDIDAIISKNTEKYNEKIKKRGALIQGINEKANVNTQRINNPYTNKVNNVSKSADEIANDKKKSAEYYSKTTNAKPGSIAAKAGMVKQYNEKNNK